MQNCVWRKSLRQAIVNLHFIRDMFYVLAVGLRLLRIVSASVVGLCCTLKVDKVLPIAAPSLPFIVDVNRVGRGLEARLLNHFNHLRRLVRIPRQLLPPQG